MDSRKNITAESLITELKLLRRGQGVEGESFLRTHLLKLLLGTDRPTFKKHLTDAIERLVNDDRWKECLVVAFNIDDAESNNDLTARRREFVSMYKISDRTATRWEDQAIQCLAQRLVNDSKLFGHPYDSRSGARQEASTIIESVTEKICFMENQLAEAKLLLDRLKELI